MKNNIGKKNTYSNQLKNRRGNSGWAFTKKYPHENHPAKFRKIGKDDINYVTFTHSEEVDMLDGTKVKTIPLTSNINKNERGKFTSYVFPKLYKGKRSALGKGTNDFSLTSTDKKLVDKLFNELPVENVPLTGGANKYRNSIRKKHKKDNK
mgnify:CR=1 FL=1